MEESDKKYSLYNNYLASTILAICVASLVLLLFLSKCQQHNHVETTQKIVVVVDSTGQATAPSDSLTKVIERINSTIKENERILETKYKSLIEKEEKDENLFSIASIIVGIILSILGFFGFKNFQSIEEKAKDIAEEKARYYLNDNLKKLLSETLDNNFLSEIQKTVTKNIEDGMVKKLQKDIEKVEQQEKEHKIYKVQGKLSTIRIDRLEQAWENKFNESFGKINLDKADVENSDREQEDDNPFDDTEA